MTYVKRIIPLKETLAKKSVLLLGPRRTGKSSLLRHEIKADQVFDLLKSDDFQSLSNRPSFLRESLRPSDRIVIVDEIQKLPQLMDEVHSLIEERGIRFILTGSSARKLKRTHTSLMAGRARKQILHPFCFPEIEKTFSIEKVLSTGSLPPAYLADEEGDAWLELRDYAGDYLREEILAEALVRKIDAFSRFLPIAARMNGELLNYTAIGSDAQVPTRTVREYFAILEDTLIGTTLEPHRFRGAKSRKSIATGKFYFFDCGILNALLNRRTVGRETPEFGNLFETWVYLELKAFADYRRPSGEMEISFWRNPSGEEVDFLLNQEIAIEVKSSRSISERHAKGLEALNDLLPLKRRIIVCHESRRRTVRGVEILPWRAFLEELWSGKIA